jgi:hypothetical protein
LKQKARALCRKVGAGFRQKTMRQQRDTASDPKRVLL